MNVVRMVIFETFYHLYNRQSTVFPLTKSEECLLKESVEPAASCLLPVEVE